MEGSDFKETTRFTPERLVHQQWWSQALLVYQEGTGDAFTKHDPLQNSAGDV